MAVQVDRFVLPESGAPGENARDMLILEHVAQVRLIASRVHERLPISVSLEDLISAGIVGLIAAIDHYDARQNVKLKTYAEFKIRGAILDSLRSLDWAPRQERKRVRVIESAIASLEKQFHRVPTEEEIAEHLGVTIATYRGWLSAACGLTIGSLEAVHSADNERCLLQYLSDRDVASPAQIFEKAELEHLLSSFLEQLPTLERTVLNLYFYEEMTLREIAAILALHESRISQLKSQAILRIRVNMTTLLDRGQESDSVSTPYDSGPAR